MVTAMAQVVIATLAAFPADPEYTILATTIAGYIRVLHTCFKDYQEWFHKLPESSF